MIKTIIFDLDNTLIDFMRMKRISCEAAMDAMIKSGLKIDKEKAKVKPDYVINDIKDLLEMKL